MQTISNLNSDQLLSDLAVAHPAASRVFHRHRLDFCCHGRVSLREACKRAGLDAVSVLAELRQAVTAAEPEQRFDELPMAEVVDHLLKHYHADHREDVPRLAAMARRVEDVHAERMDRPVGLADHLDRMQASLEEHMQKEEMVLFPMLHAGRGRHAGMPIAIMEDEHRDHGENLAELRRLANDYVPPADACSTWQALYLGLHELERKLMEHIHLENNVLFPRALAG
jgi:regulator of cell morphogenesis and NO signaling